MKKFFTNCPRNFDFNNKIHCFLGFASLIFFAQFIVYFITNGQPVFTTNDAYGYYLTEAKNIYRQGSIHDISKLGLDLYFDQVEFANYDVLQFKPYHFPIYSSFLSLFFYFFEDEFFVIASSQFLLCLTMLCFWHLILINYLDSKKSFLILVTALFCSPILIFTCDSNAELFTGALLAMIFYLGLFAKKRSGFFYYAGVFLVCSVAFLRIKYLVLIPLMCLIYRALPQKINKKFGTEDQKIDTKNLIFFAIFGIFLPYFLSYYAYENLGWHYLPLKIFDLEFFKNFFQNLYFRTLFLLKLDLISMYHNLVIALLMLVGAIFFLKEIVKNYRLKKLSKTLVVAGFYYIFFVVMIFFYSFDGYRMLISGVPIIYYLIHQNCNFEKSKNYIIAILGFISFLNIEIIEGISSHQQKIASQMQILEKVMDDYGVNKIAIESNSIDNIFQLPMMHLMKPEKHVMMFYFVKKICDNLNKYSQNNFEFDLIILSEKRASDCQFVEKNYAIQNSFNVELRKDLKIYLNKKFSKN